ncbi:MAG: hypothetical protein JW828_05850 [Sedimentisphaerales bacterium]|nr:hypothetical protein [Sedimentisphaerales bacterium]
MKTYLPLWFIMHVVLCSVSLVIGQAENFTAIQARVDFDRPLRPWDGFGVNYVEVPQTVDYNKDPQEYGGFSLLTEQQRQEICDLVFGADGLQPGLVKMFYDPWHQEDPEGSLDHERTTKWMRYFVREGLKRTRDRGDDLTIMTTLYGPPAWATKQKFLRGRDLDRIMRKDLAEYLIDWIKFLREQEKLPVRYVSLHNEGEDWLRWPADGNDGNIGKGHDYNMFWPPEQIVDFLILLRPMLDDAGLQDVGITPGESTNWFRFHTWGYADAIADNPTALENLGLITSHGFYSGTYGRWFGDHRSVGIDSLREKRPELHAWVTSTSWSRMDCRNLFEMYGNIYSAKVNGIIPWAAVQRPAKWVGGDPNPGCAVRVYEDGRYEIMRGYYYYKQICRAGRPGMAVARTMSMDSESAIIAFSSNGTKHPDAFILVNIADKQRKFVVRINGIASRTFEAYRTTDEADRYKNLGLVSINRGILHYEAPALSVTTFYAK